MEEANKLRERARHYRELASQQMDERVKKALLETAEELVNEARTREASAPSPPKP